MSLKSSHRGTLKSAPAWFGATFPRLENGHTVPAIETLEKMARAFEVPMYQIFYDGEEPPTLPNLTKRQSSGETSWGSSGKDSRYLSKLRRLLAKSDNQHRKLLMHVLPENGT